MSCLSWKGPASQHRYEEDGSATGYDLVRSAEARMRYRTCSSSSVGVQLVGLETYDVTGMSPQSMTFAHELNGFAFSGTLYPPLNPTLREPLCPGEQK